MTESLLILIAILALLVLLFFSLWFWTGEKLKTKKRELEESNKMLGACRSAFEKQVEEKIEIEKRLQDSVGNGSSDSFNSSIDLMQKLNDKGKSRS